MASLRNLVLAAGLTAFGLAGGLAAARAEQGVTDDTITIGAYGPLTGPGASVGLGARDGFNLAAKEINDAGGINGRKLKILAEDDGYSPARALAATKKLIDQDGVFMIVSLGGSNDTLGTIDTMKSRQMILYASIASVPAITQPFNKYLFRGATAEVARYSEVNTEFATQELQASKIAIISGRDEYSHNESEGDIKILQSWWNLTPVARVEFNIGDHDFTPQILQIKAASPDLIMVVANPAEGVVIIRQIRELGLTTPMFVSSTLVDKATAASAGAAAEGLTSSYLLPYEFDSRNPDMVKWLAAWHKEYTDRPPGRPNHYDLMAYTDMYAIAEGLRRAGRDLTTDKMIAALETLKDYRVSDIASARTFTATSHTGNRFSQAMVLLSGRWMPLAWKPQHPSDIFK